MTIFDERKRQFLKIAEELAEQFNKKNIDYGDSYFNTDTEGFAIDKTLSGIDFYIQLRRKFSRLANFAESRLKGNLLNAKVIDETEDDTITDIAVYCIMELMKRRNKNE